MTLKGKKKNWLKQWHLWNKQYLLSFPSLHRTKGWLGAAGFGGQNNCLRNISRLELLCCTAQYQYMLDVQRGRRSCQPWHLNNGSFLTLMPQVDKHPTVILPSWRYTLSAEEMVDVWVENAAMTGAFKRQFQRPRTTICSQSCGQEIRPSTVKMVL